MAFLEYVGRDLDRIADHALDRPVPAVQLWLDILDGDGWVSFGSYGHGPGQFYLPHDVAVDNLGRIYIADTANQRIVRINSMAGDGWVELARGAAMASDISGPFLLSAPKGMRVLGSGPSLTCIQQYFRRWRSAADIAHPSSE